MSDKELKEQFDRCVIWQDAAQWDELALQYFQRGYYLNASHCFTRADECRTTNLAVAEVM